MIAPAAAVRETAREKAENIVRNVLSPPDPARPGKKLHQSPLINLKTGRLTGPLSKALQQIKDNGGWWGPCCQDPATTLTSSIDDYILYDQRIYINHPLVSAGLVHRGLSATTAAAAVVPTARWGLQVGNQVQGQETIESALHGAGAVQ